MAHSIGTFRFQRIGKRKKSKCNKARDKIFKNMERPDKYDTYVLHLIQYVKAWVGFWDVRNKYIQAKQSNRWVVTNQGEITADYKEIEKTIKKNGKDITLIINIPINKPWSMVKPYIDDASNTGKNTFVTLVDWREEANHWTGMALYNNEKKFRILDPAPPGDDVYLEYEYLNQIKSFFKKKGYEELPQTKPCQFSTNDGFCQTWSVWRLFNMDVQLPDDESKRLDIILSFIRDMIVTVKNDFKQWFNNANKEWHDFPCGRTCTGCKTGYAAVKMLKGIDGKSFLRALDNDNTIACEDKCTELKTK